MEVKNTNEDPNKQELSHLSEQAASDYQLVQRALEGKQAAFTELMARYKEPVYHTLYKMLSSREDANDLTQEAFAKAFRKLHLYTPTFAFSTWLFKIAINNCIDHIRKRRLQMLSIDEPIENDGKQDYSDNLRANTLNPEQHFIRKQRVDVMRKLLSKLSPKYRLMLELRFFEELTYQEIANELGIPLGTVKAQLYRAKELLYGLLDEDQIRRWL